MLAMAEETYSPQVAAVLNKLGLDDVIAREHYIRHPTGHMDLLGSKSGVSRPGNSTIWSKRTRGIVLPMNLLPAIFPLTRTVNRTHKLRFFT
jgi:hypothetical protein